MILHFNVTGEKRKDMVKAIEKELDIKSKYLGMPSAASAEAKGIEQFETDIEKALKG